MNTFVICQAKNNDHAIITLETSQFLVFIPQGTHDMLKTKHIANIPSYLIIIRVGIF